MCYIHIGWVLQNFLPLFNGPELLLTIWKIHNSLFCFPLGWLLMVSCIWKGPILQWNLKEEWASTASGPGWDIPCFHRDAFLSTLPGAVVSCFWSWRQWEDLQGIKLSISTMQNQPQGSLMYTTEYRNANHLDFQIKISNLQAKNIWVKMLMVKFSSWDMLMEFFPIALTSECRNSHTRHKYP